MAGDGAVVGLDADALEALEDFPEVRRDPRIQLEQATQAAQVFLQALGVDLSPRWDGGHSGPDGACLR